MKLKPIIFSLIAVAVLGTAVAFGLPALDRMERLRMAGELEKAKQEAIANGQDYVVARGNNIEIKNPEVDRIVAGYEMLNSPKGKADAIDFLAKRVALEAEAIRQGYTVTEEEVQDYINLQLEMGKNASNYHEFAEFLEGAQMTAEEYWQSQHDILRQELIYGQMLKDLKAQWSQQETYSDMTQEERTAQINQRIEALKTELLEAEDLVIIE